MKFFEEKTFETNFRSDPKKTLGIKLPYLVMIIKNMKKYFTFEVQVRMGQIKTASWYVEINILAIN